MSNDLSPLAYFHQYPLISTNFLSAICYNISMNNLLIVGSIGFDTIQTPFGKISRALGGSATHFCLAARYFTRPALVSAAGRDFTARHKKLLTSRGINLDGLQLGPGKTMAWSARYGYDLNTRKVLFTRLNVLGGFQPKLPKSLTNSQLLFLSSVSSTQQQKVLSQLKKPKFVGWDTISYYIEHDRAGLIKNLKAVDCCFINDTEARELTREHNLLKGAKGIMGMMGKNATLIIKRGEYGLLMFHQDAIFHLPGFPLEDVVDPTGAGDSFAGGFMGWLAKTDDFSFENLKRACVYGSVMASFCCEKLGTERLQTVTADEISGRYKKFKELTHFDLV